MSQSLPLHPQILLLDPAHRVGVVLERLLERHGCLVESTHSLESSLKRACPQLICLPVPDAMIWPVEDVLSWLQQFRLAVGWVPCLLLADAPPKKAQTFFYTWLERLLSFDGVDFIPFPLSGKLLALKCRHLMNGSPPLQTEISNRLNTAPYLQAFSLLKSLSQRESEVLHCIGLGLSNQEISQQLTLSPHSVRTHVYNIFSKLGLQRRSQAAVLDLYRSVSVFPKA